MTYEISLSAEAKDFLKSLDGRTRLTVARRIEVLKEIPGKQGKALTGDLTDYRSIPAAGRCRVIYELPADSPRVVITAMGFRKEGSKIDVHETLKKLMRSKIFQ